MATIHSRWASPAGGEDLSCWQRAERLARGLPSGWIVICGLASLGWSLPVVIRGEAGEVIARSDSIDDGTRYLQLALFLERVVPQFEGCAQTPQPVLAPS